MSYIVWSPPPLILMVQGKKKASHIAFCDEGTAFLPSRAVARMRHAGVGGWLFEVRFLLMSMHPHMQPCTALSMAYLRIVKMCIHLRKWP